MGCGGSKPEEVDSAAKARSDAIEKQLKQAERDARQDVKLLFLGAGGAYSATDSASMSEYNADTTGPLARNATVLHQSQGVSEEVP